MHALREGEEMNDFTKEELEYIKYWCQVDFKIKNKIQAMIDSYCEHEPSDKYPNGFKWQLCVKCGKEYK